MTSAALEVLGLAYGYGEAPLFSALDWRVERGEFVGLVGPNGSGKTTLLRLLAGLAEPDAGEVRLLGRPLGDYGRRERARALAYMSQDQPPPFAFPVASVVEMGRFPYTGRFRAPDAEDDAIVAEAMAVADVAAFAARPLTELSGGERQRVLLARALAQSPRVLLLDEPTANLDLRHAVAFFQVVRALSRRAGATVVAVLHDLSFAAAVCDRIALLDRGRLAADGAPADVLQSDRLSEVFGTRIAVTPEAEGGPLFVRATMAAEAALPERLTRAVRGGRPS